MATEKFRKTVPRTDRVESVLVDGIEWCVSETGAISVYGAGRFPVTMYPDFIREKMFAGIEPGVDSVPAEILQFMLDNESLLAKREDRLADGAKSKVDTYDLSANDQQLIGTIADAVLSVENQPAERTKFAATLMSIKSTAELSKGKVTYDQLVFAKNAILSAREAQARK